MGPDDDDPELVPYEPEPEPNDDDEPVLIRYEPPKEDGDDDGDDGEAGLVLDPDPDPLPQPAAADKDDETGEAPHTQVDDRHVHRLRPPHEL